MAARKKPKPDDPEQSARFREAARKVDADDAFDRALKVIIPPKSRSEKMLSLGSRL